MKNKFLILLIATTLSFSIPVLASNIQEQPYFSEQIEITQTPTPTIIEEQENIQTPTPTIIEEQETQNIPTIELEQEEEPILLQGNNKKPALTQQEPAPATLIINKQLISGVWHVACDVMGDKAWVKDQISNPEGIPAKQGHRLAYCGDPYHWIIYLDTYGNPYQMDEIHSGATGGTLNTKFYTDGTYTEQIDISELQVNQRIYWTTENKGQVWHHTGITFPEIPTFTFIINGEPIDVTVGETVTLSNLSPGTYEIIEKYNPDFFVNSVSLPYTIDENQDVIVSVNLNENDNTVVNFINQRITPEPEPEEPIPTQEPLPTETPIEEPIQTPTPTEEPIETPIPTEEPVQTPVPTEEPTPTEEITPTQTLIPTQEPIETLIPTEEPDQQEPTFQPQKDINPTKQPTTSKSHQDDKKQYKNTTTINNNDVDVHEENDNDKEKNITKKSKPTISPKQNIIISPKQNVITSTSSYSTPKDTQITKVREIPKTGDNNLKKIILLSILFMSSLGIIFAFIKKF